MIKSCIVNFKWGHLIKVVNEDMKKTIDIKYKTENA